MRDMTFRVYYFYREAAIIISFSTGPWTHRRYSDVIFWCKVDGIWLFVFHMVLCILVPYIHNVALDFFLYSL